MVNHGLSTLGSPCLDFSDLLPSETLGCMKSVLNVNFWADTKNVTIGTFMVTIGTFFVYFG